MLGQLRRRSIALVVAGSLGLSGCASYGGYNEGPLTPAQRELRDRNQRYNETVGVGLTAGAILGALAGALLAGKNSRGSGALIGGAAGAALGGAGGAAIADRNQRYASREQELNARITAAQKEANDFREMAALSERIRADNEKRLAELDASYKSGRISAAQYRREAQSMERDVAELRRSLEANDKVLASIQQDANRMGGAAGASLRSSRDDIATSRRRIVDNTDDLVRALAAVPPA